MSTTTTLNLSSIFAHLDTLPEVTVWTDDDGSTTVRLYWTDGVANEWEETYGSLSSALARLAILAYCGEDDWQSSFATHDLKFVEAFNQYAATQVC